MTNTEIYNRFREVPEAAKKTIQAGNIKGFTDINPMWRIQCLTEQFGPCGKGWYIDIVSQWLEEGKDGKVAAFCNINLYVKYGDEWSKPIVGTGGSSFVNIFKDKPTTSDEAYKMAYTDAISVACKALGIGADVYWAEGKTKYDRPAEDPAKVMATPAMISVVKKNIQALNVNEAGLLEKTLKINSWEECTIEHFNKAMRLFEKYKTEEKA
jgi:hypothetical protein